MMLSTALTMMIDKTECLIFLNTPNSITASELIEQTESPWIYSEIAVTNMIRKKLPSEHRAVYKSFSIKKSLYVESLKVKYDLPLDHLTNMDSETLLEWANYVKDNNINALDALYKII